MNINNGNNNLGFNKKTSDKKVLKKIEELEEKINDIEVGDIDLKDYAKTEDIPTKTSELVNDSNYIDKEYVDYTIDGIEKIAFSDVEPTDGDINIWINTAEDIKDEWNIIQINDKTTSSSSAWSSEKTSNQINNKISQLKAENDKKYVTEGYVKEQIEKAELEGVDIDLSDYAKKTDLHTHNNKLVLDSVTSKKINEWNNKSDFSGDYNDLTNKPNVHIHNNKSTLDNITSEKINEWDNKSDFSGDYNDLTNKPNVENLVSKENMEEYVDNAIENVEINGMYLHTHNNKSALDDITSEKINEWDNKSDFSGDYNDLTNKPDVENLVSKENMEEYVDNAIENVEINGMYLHTHNNKSALDDITSEKINEWDNKSDFSGDYNDLANKPNVPTKISQLTNDSNFINSIPSEYVTESELNRKGYLTQHQDISGKADKTELHSHNNKSALDTITATRITVWNNKSDFSGNYNDLTNKPTIPSIKGLATETFVKNEIVNIKEQLNYINVLDYGVKEGLDVDVKTNTTAFQSILDTYGDTKIILFPPGNFIFNPIDLREKRNITIEGFSSSFASFSQKNIYTGQITDTFTKIICAKNTDATFFKHKNCVLVMKNLGFYNVLINGTSFDLQTPAKTNVFMQHTVTDGAGNNVEKGKVFITDCAFFGWKVVFGNGFTMQHLEDEWGTGKSESKYDFFKQSCVMANRCRFTKNGVGVNQSVDARLIDCSFNKNDYGIVFRKDSGFSSVIGCRIEWNNYNGIYVKEAHDVTISECEFDCNGYAGLYAEGNTNSNFNNNVYRRNGAKIKNVDDDSHKLDYINNVHIYAYNNTDCNFIGNNTLAKTTSDVGSSLIRPSNCVGFDSNINCIISMNNFQGCTRGDKLDGSLIKNNVNCVIVNNIPNIVQK